MLSNTKEPQKGNWRYLLVAFLLALGLWYTLNAREQIERVVARCALIIRGCRPD